MLRLALLALVAVASVAAPAPLPGQSRAAQLIDAARAQLAAGHADSAAALLHAALDTATQATRAERQSALVWQGVLEFLQGDERLAREVLRAALALDTTLAVQGLDRLSPTLAQMFRQEKEAAARRGFVYVAAHVDEPPRRMSGPAVVYPSSLLHTHVQGVVHVAAIIDTTGRAEPASLEVLAVPDSALVDPVKQMLLVSQFSVGRLKGTAVRVLIQLGVEVRPPRLSATKLVTTARAQLAAHRTDSACTLLAIALDTAITHPTEGEQAYALLVRGLAQSVAGRDSTARADVAAGLARYQDLTARGINVAPFLKRLVDSLRFGRAATRRAGGAVMPAPTAVDVVEDQPVLVSHPAIGYPSELEALRIGGTVVLEAVVDSAGRVVATSVTVVNTPNQAFDGEARRVVQGSIYRPARSRGKPVRAVIRQAITFRPY